jgi:hypothetical protein
MGTCMDFNVLPYMAFDSWEVPSFTDGHIKPSYITVTEG